MPVINNYGINNGFLSNLSEIITQYFTERNLTHGTTTEVIMIFHKPLLELKMKKKGIVENNPDKMVFDVICCNIKNKESMMLQHGFSPIPDRIIFEREVPNALDSFRYIEQHVDPRYVRIIRKREFPRKIVIDRSYGFEFHRTLNRLIRVPITRRNEVIRIISEIFMIITGIAELNPVIRNHLLIIIQNLGL